jgi:hypothetical protein
MASLSAAFAAFFYEKFLQVFALHCINVSLLCILLSSKVINLFFDVREAFYADQIA